MAVSNYNLEKCKYNFSKLKPVIYLVSEDHVKEVFIDDSGAHISGLTELPLRINGFNIQFNEESSLDERYQFQKTLTLSMHGYVNYKIFGGRQYAIIENESGQRFMINVDFPSRITHTFNLSKNVNQTDFTFSCLSNFPTLKLDSDFEGVEPVCLGFNVYGIEKLELLEKEKTILNTAEKTVISTEDFKNIEYLGNSCSFQEVYNGFDATDTISFDIPFDSTLGWNWNLLEFLNNRYSAIITPKGATNKYFSGFGIGLLPKYTIQSSTNAGESDIVTVTLTEGSNYGATAAVDWSEEQSTLTKWRYVKEVDEIVCYECIGLGRARFLVKQEVTAFGVPTGNYQALVGYSSQYQAQGLNIVGTFDETQEFNENSCTDFEACDITTTIPTTLVFTSATSNTYSLKTSCDWRITNIPSGITVSPVSGVADSTYNVTISNSATPTGIPYERTFNLQCCNTNRVINLKVQKAGTSCIQPTQRVINCLAQSVTFTYNSDCQPNVALISSQLTYSLANNQLTVNVPKNETTSSRTFTILITNCNCLSETTSISILQDRLYDRWVVESQNYVCQSGNSYVLERRYTGTTSSNINSPTSETRPGTLIQSGDTRCGSGQTRWNWDGKYYCVDGNKYKALEEEVTTDGGTTWTKTGNTKLGDFIESASTFCQQETTYKWELTSRWVCDGSAPTPSGTTKFRATYSGGTSYSADCDSSTTLTSGDTRPEGYNASAMTTAIIGNCITSLDDAAFYRCYSLSSVTIPNSVTNIGSNAFYGCNRFTNLYIPSGVTNIGIAAFYGCQNLASITIPTGVTSINNNLFTNCISLSRLNSNTVGEFNIPNTVTSIGNGAFSYCSGMTNVSIGSGVVSIGSNAFNQCGNLPNITIPSGVTNIYGNIVRGCKVLTSITVSNSNNYYSSQDGILFDKAKQTIIAYPMGKQGSSYSIPSSVTTIGEYAFDDCRGLTNISIPSTVTSIGAYAFNTCTNLSNVTIPSGVTSINTHTFYQCYSLSSITIPNNVTSIGNSAFFGCSGLISLVIPDNITNVSNNAFDRCSGLTSVTIGSGVTSINYAVFRRCNSLTSVTIPESVTRIGLYAFYECSGLTSITVEATTPPILDNTNAFTNTNNCPIYVPANSVNAYKTADNWSTYADRITAISS